MPKIAKTASGLSLSLDEQEAGILRGLTKEMRLLLQADVPPEDKVMQRLFPPAHEDEREQQSYDDLVGAELRRVKIEALETVERVLTGDAGISVDLSLEEVDEWLRLLNDLRLAIGTRLQVDDSKMEKPFDPDDPEAPALSVLHWLGWLQGTMLEEMSVDLPGPE